MAPPLAAQGQGRDFQMRRGLEPSRFWTESIKGHGTSLAGGEEEGLLTCRHHCGPEATSGHWHKAGDTVSPPPPAAVMTCPPLPFQSEDPIIYSIYIR